MQNLSIVLLLAAFSGTAAAQVHAVKGSDTLAGVMTDAIIASGMQDRLTYTGGGSGLGEKALVLKEQGIAPMSRAFSAAKLAEAQALGITPVGHVIALDGIGIFVHSSNAAQGISLASLKKIYACEWTTWQQVPGSGRTGTIKIYRRNDNSGTTDTFKHLTGLAAFGTCATAVNETADIAHATSTDAAAIGYAGMSGHVDGNRPLAVSKEDGGQRVLPTIATIRAKTYPLARELYVYEATGAYEPNDAEKEFLNDFVLDRSFLDPILQDNEFYTLD